MVGWILAGLLAFSVWLSGQTLPNYSLYEEHAVVPVHLTVYVPIVRENQCARKIGTVIVRDLEPPKIVK